jgi:hypothetical protein
MVRLKAKLRPKVKLRLKAVVRPKAKLWPKAMIRPKANNGKFFLLIALMMASFTPSQNILQSLQKWKDILEYITINWELLKSPSQKKFGANCSPSETLNESFEYSLVIDTTFNLNVAEDFSSREKALIIIAWQVCFGKR